VIVHRAYSPAVDVWSLGVVAFILLCGYAPFSADDDEALLALVARGKVTFDPRYWACVSPEAKDCVRRMLTVDPAVRPTAEALLAHPWLQPATRGARGGGGGGAGGDLSVALAALKSWKARKRLKGGISALMAARRLTSPMASPAH